MNKMIRMVMGYAQPAKPYHRYSPWERTRVKVEAGARCNAPLQETAMDPHLRGDNIKKTGKLLN